MKKILYSQKGEIDGTLMTIIGLFLVAVLMFIVPLMSVAQRTDDIALSVAQTAVSDFVNSAATSGSIKPSDYDKLVATLNSTKNTFEISIEVQHIDENNAKKGMASADLIGENLYYSTYTTEVLEYIYEYTEPGAVEAMLRNYPLKKGDIVIVKVKNTNDTLAQQLRTFAYKVTGKGTYEIEASASAMAVTDGR